MQSHGSLFGAFTIVLAGCGSDLALIQTVGPDGATLELPGGASIVIPAGALDEDVDLGIEILTDLDASGYASAPSVFGAVPLISVALTPHGQVFNQPVTLTLPFTGPSDPLALLTVDDDSDTTWQPVAGQAYAGGLATARLMHFSAFTIGAPPSSECSCWSATTLDAMLDAIPSVESTWGSSVVSFSGVNADSVYYRRTFPDVHAEIALTTDRAGQSMWTFDEDQGIWIEEPSGVTCQIEATGPMADIQLQTLFPNTAFTTTSSTSSGLSFTNDEPLVCSSLLSRFTEDSQMVPLAARLGGLPADEVVTIEVPELSVDTDLTAVGVRTLGTAAPGTAFTITIAEQPAGATCTADPSSGTLTAATEVQIRCTPTQEVCNGMDDDGDNLIDEDFDVDEDGVSTCGPDGVADTADDDCDDADAHVNPAASERCNGIDDNCDGASVAGETTDTDSDGVPDDCDAQPNTGCPAFDVADMAELTTLGGECLTNASGTAVPAVLQASGLTTWTGVFKDWSAGAFELYGVGVLSDGDDIAAGGCTEEEATNGATPCADNSRPILPIESTVTADVAAACATVAEYHCELVSDE